jgi:hypothetical protein
MQVIVENFEKENDRRDDTEMLKREVSSLQDRLKENPIKTSHLAWDTELLVKKTQSLDDRNIVSCADPNWRQIIEHMEVGPDGVRVNDVRTVEQIEFVASFASTRQLAMTYGNRSFYLEPRPTPFDFD